MSSVSVLAHLASARDELQNSKRLHESAVLAALRAGVSLKDTAKAGGIAVNTVRGIARRHGHVMSRGWKDES